VALVLFLLAFYTAVSWVALSLRAWWHSRLYSVSFLGVERRLWLGGRQVHVNSLTRKKFEQMPDINSNAVVSLFDKDKSLDKLANVFSKH
jgi:hypothetical protein